MTPLPEPQDKRFPEVPARSGEWAPVYLEPIVGSGESLTVLVVSRIDQREYALLRTLDEQRAKCMYGHHAAAICGFIDLIESSLNAFLSEGRRLSDWAPPLRDSVRLGIVSFALGDSAEEIARTGAMLTASLAVYIPQQAIPHDERSESDGDEWERLIRAGTIQLRQEFAPRFARRVELKQGAPTTRIGYLGPRLAAQFGRLTPGKGLTNSRNRAKAYVTELQILRDLDAETLNGVRPHYELMLWVPPSDSRSYSAGQRDDARGAFAELEAFGDKHELRVEALQEHTMAVGRILRAEDPPPVEEVAAVITQ